MTFRTINVQRSHRNDSFSCGDKARDLKKQMADFVYGCGEPAQHSAVTYLWPHLASISGLPVRWRGGADVGAGPD